MTVLQTVLHSTYVLGVDMPHPGVQHYRHYIQGLIADSCCNMLYEKGVISD